MDTHSITQIYKKCGFRFNGCHARKTRQRSLADDGYYDVNDSSCNNYNNNNA